MAQKNEGINVAQKLIDKLTQNINLIGTNQSHPIQNRKPERQKERNEKAS